MKVGDIVRIDFGTGLRCRLLERGWADYRTDRWKGPLPLLPPGVVLQLQPDDEDLPVAAWRLEAIDEDLPAGLWEYEYRIAKDKGDE